MTRYNIILLLAAMIGAGLLGGTANYLLLHQNDPEYARRSRSSILGLVASFLTPLFLKSISSDMVDKITTIRYGYGIPFEFFVFASFCLLAAVFSRIFAETVAKRVSAEVEKAKREAREAQIRAARAEEKAREAEPVLRQVMEERTEPLPDCARNSIPPALQRLSVDNTDRDLLRALLNGNYSYRTTGSLAEEVQMEEPDAAKHLEKLREHALTGKKATPTRHLWFLTDDGCTWLGTQAHSEEPSRGNSLM